MPFTYFEPTYSDNDYPRSKKFEAINTRNQMEIRLKVREIERIPLEEMTVEDAYMYGQLIKNNEQ